MNEQERNDALEYHRKSKGKVKIYSTLSVRNEYDLSMAYVPGSTIAAEEIRKNPNTVYDYTGKGNRLAVICNGSAIKHSDVH